MILRTGITSENSWVGLIQNSLATFPIYSVLGSEEWKYSPAAVWKRELPEFTSLISVENIIILNYYLHPLLPHSTSGPSKFAFPLFPFIQVCGWCLDGQQQRTDEREEIKIHFLCRKTNCKVSWLLARWLSE